MNHNHAQRAAWKMIRVQAVALKWKLESDQTGC